MTLRIPIALLRWSIRRMNVGDTPHSPARGLRPAIRFCIQQDCDRALVRCLYEL
jgi:hypothetical protein